MTLYDFYIDFFYYHPLSTMFLWGVYAVIAWAMLARLLCRHKKLWTWVNRVGWIAVTLVILWGTVLNRTSSERQLSMLPLHFLEAGKTNEEHYRSAMVNYLLFIPYGLTMPFALPNQLRHRACITVLTACALSLCIELTQYYFGLGLCETDDVLLNTLGAIVGAVVSGIC